MYFPCVNVDEYLLLNNRISCFSCFMFHFMFLFIFQYFMIFNSLRLLLVFAHISLITELDCAFNVLKRCVIIAKLS